MKGDDYNVCDGVNKYELMLGTYGKVENYSGMYTYDEFVAKLQNLAYLNFYDLLDYSKIESAILLDGKPLIFDYHRCFKLKYVYYLDGNYIILGSNLRAYALYGTSFSYKDYVVDNGILHYINDNMEPEIINIDNSLGLMLKLEIDPTAVKLDVDTILQYNLEIATLQALG